MAGEYILNVALCLIQHEGKILLLRREKEPYRGWLALPGGKIHFAETPVQAALREAEEETGLHFLSARPLGCATEIIRHAEAPVAHFILFPILLENGSGKLRPSDEGHLQWLPLTALSEDVIPTDRELITGYLIRSAFTLGCVPHFEIEENGKGYQLISIT